MGRAPYISMFASPSREDKAIANDVIDQVGIARFRNRPYTQLSGGEKQLVLIARALAQQTPLIIMDEPTAHLDFRHEFVVLETMMRLSRDHNISIIMATHFPNHAFYFQSQAIPTRAAMLHNGQFISMGQPDTVLTAARIRQLYGIDAQVVEFDRNGTLQKNVIPVKTLV